MHVEINASDSTARKDSGEAFRLGGRPSDVARDGLPHVSDRRGSGRRNRGGQEPGALTVYFDTPDIDASLAKGAGAGRRGRGQDAGAGPTACSPAARTPRGTRSASGRATNLRRSRRLRLDQTTAGGSSSRSTSGDGSGQALPSFRVRVVLLAHPSLNAEASPPVTYRGDRGRAAPALAPRRTAPAATTSTSAVARARCGKALAHPSGIDAPLV